MKNRFRSLVYTAGVGCALGLSAASANATVYDLADGAACGDTATEISLSDVTWDQKPGGDTSADKCWELPSGSNVQSGSVNMKLGNLLFSEEYKVDGSSGSSGGSGPVYTVDNEEDGDTDDSWSLSTASPIGPFLIWLKAGSAKIGVWLFDHAGAYTGTAYSGTWDIKFRNNGGQIPGLSNSGLAATESPSTHTTVPAPSSIATVLLGLLLLRLRHRRRS